MIKNIRHTGIVVDNLDSSLFFYCDILGFKITKRMDESGKYIDAMSSLNGIKVTTIKMAAPCGQLIELLKFHSHPEKQKPKSINDIGIAHIAFEVEDLDTEYNRLKGEGVRFNSSPQLSSDGYAKVAFCKAPEGTFIELVEVL